MNVAGLSAASPPPQPPSGTARKSVALPGDFVRFLDSVTETPVVRLTGLASSNLLPAPDNRAVSVKGHFLVFSSDRTGALSPFRLDLRTAQITELATPKNLNTSSLSLDTPGRFLWFISGGSLTRLTLGNKHLQVTAEDVSHYSVDGSSQEWIVIRDRKLLNGTDSRVLAADVFWCQLRPGTAESCAFARGTAEVVEELWYLPFRDAAKPIRVASGPIHNPCWSPDGRSLLFLRNRSICEIVPESGTERPLGNGSQFVSFSANADSSVFVGAVQSKAQPTINLLLRHPAREFTLCEHKASHPEQCVPVFSPDSRRVYFNSDFQGKPAIYSVNVEALIEETSG